MKAFVTSGTVENGKLKGLRDRAGLESWADQVGYGEIVVTFEKAHATRSKKANALYWAGFVGPISDYTGNSLKWVHAYLKARFLPKHKIEIVDRQTGAVIDERELEELTTTTLTSDEFSDYLHAIREWVEEEFRGQVRVGSSEEAA